MEVEGATTVGHGDCCSAIKPATAKGPGLDGRERERTREGERECAGECDGEEEEEGAALRSRRKECNFIVESKDFEIIGDERKEKSKPSLWRRREGMRKKQDGEGSGRTGSNIFYVTRNKQSGGVYPARGHRSREETFLHLHPERQKGKRGWMTMAEKLKEVIGSFVSKSETQEGKAMGKIVGGSSYATIAKRALLGNPNVIVVKVKSEKSMGLLKKLEHCVVASRKDNLGGDDDLEKLGQVWAKSWELKDSLGLAKMEKGRVLLEFEDWKRRVVLYLLGIARWKESRDLKKVGDECGGFITVDEQTKTLGELQWARILVRGRGDARPSVLEVEVEEEVYAVSLWWECRPVIRRSCRQADGRRSSEVREDGTGEQRTDSGRAVSNAARSPIILSWAQPGAVHHLSPTASPKELRGVGGPRLKSGVMGLKMKGVAASPEAGPSYRPDEGPSSSAGQDHNISQNKDLLLTGLDPETDKALEEESMRYGRGLCTWGKRVLGISHLNSFNFDRTPGGESFDHSGDWNEEVRADNTMWLTVYEGCIERSNGARKWEQMKAAVIRAGECLGLGTGQRAPDCDCPMKMKILSWNVRGANDSSKRKVIKTFIRNQRVDVICIQETKIQAMSDNIARSIGSGRFLEWKAVNAEELREDSDLLG
ncbi:hypothetical protein CK203_106843 [Vitis vinifera]|uniref:DUF4283 domain-containing protein n=1 Tax=Vitis vinifera TaxID=29760 RepID=A0A438EQQ3_VITVI|nr:hypothetical protein CK203_106843 [Vitis vinifera]